MNDEEKPDKDLWDHLGKKKPGSLSIQTHYTLEEGEWTEIPTSFSTEPLWTEEAVCYVPYCITRRTEEGA